MLFRHNTKTCSINTIEIMYGSHKHCFLYTYLSKKFFIQQQEKKKSLGNSRQESNFKEVVFFFVVYFFSSGSLIKFKVPFLQWKFSLSTSRRPKQTLVPNWHCQLLVKKERKKKFFEVCGALVECKQCLISIVT